MAGCGSWRPYAAYGGGHRERSDRTARSGLGSSTKAGARRKHCTCLGGLPRPAAATPRASARPARPARDARDASTRTKAARDRREFGSSGYPDLLRGAWLRSARRRCSNRRRGGRARWRTPPADAAGQGPGEREREQHSRRCARCSAPHGRPSRGTAGGLRWDAAIAAGRHWGPCWT